MPAPSKAPSAIRAGAVVPAADGDADQQGDRRGAERHHQRGWLLSVLRRSPTVSIPSASSLQGFRTIIQDHIQLQVAEITNRQPSDRRRRGGRGGHGAAPPRRSIETAARPRLGTHRGESNQGPALSPAATFSVWSCSPRACIGRATGGTQAYAQSNSDLYSNEYSVNMNANGARTESNNFLIDSSTVSSSQRSGVVNINPNTESVQEVRVSVNNFSAEYGRNGSVLVNIVTKSGTNNLHGGGSYYYTNNDLQAKNQFEKRTTGFAIRFQPQGVLLGSRRAARKDRTFFFASGDVLRSGRRDQPSDTTVITPDFIAVHAAEPARATCRRFVMHNSFRPPSRRTAICARPGSSSTHPAPARRRLLLRRVDSLRLSSDRASAPGTNRLHATVCSGRHESITPSMAAAIGFTAR